MVHLLQAYCRRDASPSLHSLSLSPSLHSLPVLVAVGAFSGRLVAVPLSQLDHTVRLAEQVRMEETGQVTVPTDASEAFHETGRPARELYVEAIRRREQFAQAGVWLGLWIGLVIGAKLVHLAVRRRRTEYLPDRGGCVSCGRCFWYCPGEKARLGLIQDLSNPSGASNAGCTH